MDPWNHLLVLSILVAIYVAMGYWYSFSLSINSPTVIRTANLKLLMSEQRTQHLLVENYFDSAEAEMESSFLLLAA